MQLGSKFLFVCIGNICRSPAAEGFLSAYFQKKLLSAEVASAGIRAMVGAAPVPIGQKIMQENYQINISDHRAQQLTEEMIRYNDLIFVMDDEQTAYLKKVAPFASGKIHKLGKWRNTDIADPYLQSDSVFESCYALIQDCVQDWVERLQ